MDALEEITRVFKESKEISFDDSSKIVLMSDCHRGDGSLADDFLKNQNIFFTALTHYYNENYIYIEIGDGDELWENRKMSDIIEVHYDVFRLLTKFYNKNRLYLIYGNHDIAKRNKKFVKNNLYRYFDENKKRYIDLFKNITIHEGLKLKYSPTGDKIFLIHGHQGEWINDRMWWLGRFLVRYLWRTLELLGVKDLTSTAKNYVNKERADRKLIHWVQKEKHLLIAGHTHRPMFPETEQTPYFNDGSCIHLRCITAIEISGGNIMLVKWCIETKSDGALFITRKILAGPNKLEDYFSKL